MVQSVLRLTLVVTVLFQCVPAMAQRGGRGAGPPGANAPNEGRGQGGPSLKIERDVEYARPGGQPLTLDLYHLEPLASPRPVVVWIHGTGSGATKLTTPAVALVSPTGVAVASIDYRTTPGTTLQMQLGDAKSAIRWLRVNASKYNLDSAHIAVFGYGVGGQLAALLGTTSGVSTLEGDEGNLGQSSQVQAVVDVAGAMTTGGLNPVDYVTKDDAPTRIIHGTNDTEVSTMPDADLRAESGGNQRDVRNARG